MRDPILVSKLKERGAVRRIASAVDRTPSAVSQWQRVPAEHVTKVASIFGVAPHELRPDVFPAPSEEAA